MGTEREKKMKKTMICIVALFLMVGIATAEEALDIPPVTLIQNVNVWDGLANDVQPGVDVLVVGNTIRKVARNIPATATYEVDVKREKIKKKRVNAGTGEGYTLYVVDEKGGTRKEQVPVKVIDGKGGTLIPGLIDMHVHLATAEGLGDGRDNWDSFSIGAVAAHNLVLFLEQGFTTVRGAGGPDLGLAKAIRAGRIPGPRFYPAGPWITQTAGHADLGYWTDPMGWKDYSELTETSHVVDGRAEILKAVRYNLRKGATHIKLMGGGGVSSEFDPLNTTQFTLDEMKTAVEATEDWGTYVMTHAYHDRSVNRAIDAGVKCIEHGGSSGRCRDSWDMTVFPTQPRFPPSSRKTRKRRPPSCLRVSPRWRNGPGKTVCLLFPVLTPLAWIS
jgi:imidazolonepropionase-like amidohydrolase